MEKNLKDFTDVELYKAKAELLAQALQLNQNLTALGQEIASREAEPKKE